MIRLLLCFSVSLSQSWNSLDNPGSLAHRHATVKPFDQIFSATDCLIVSSQFTGRDLANVSRITIVTGSGVNGNVVIKVRIVVAMSDAAPRSMWISNDGGNVPSGESVCTTTGDPQVDPSDEQQDSRLGMLSCEVSSDGCMTQGW